MDTSFKELSQGNENSYQLSIFTFSENQYVYLNKLNFILSRIVKYLIIKKLPKTHNFNVSFM